MTRINVVPVETLTQQHLVAEYRELPRIFALAHKASVSPKPWQHKQPKEYTLGTGHVIFFYDKLGWLNERHQQLVQEMLKRGYKPSFTAWLSDEWESKIPPAYWRSYIPTPEAIAINVERINKRLSGDKS